MWKTIEHILMSPNATVILVFIVFIVIVAVALSKTGLLNIHTKAVEIGATNKEREIIRRQIEWVKGIARAWRVNFLNRRITILGEGVISLKKYMTNMWSGLH